MNSRLNSLWLGRSLHRVLSGAVVVLLALSVGGCNKLKARDALNKGVTAYKAGQFDRAIEYFMQAKELDRGLINARLYLATAYASQYIPGAPSEDNVRNGQRAIEEFQEVLGIEPGNLSAIDGIGSILYQMAATPFTPAKFEESKTYHLRHIGLKPEDPEPYYWVGVIDWTLSFRANADIRAAYNRGAPRKQVKDDQPLPPRAREDYAARYGPMVNEGIDRLKKAIELRPDYEDAMAYLNLLYRRKADMVASMEERDSLLRQADELVDKVKEIKQKKMEQPAKI
jgi:tetratricopeptide (TPR) repeat protein